MDSLLSRYIGSRAVDYLRVDIEGAERLLFERESGWADRVRCTTVEVHDSYSAASCVSDLRGLGFDAWVDFYREYSVVAMRR